MKTKIAAVLLTIMFGGLAGYAQDQTKSNQHQTPSKTEKTSVQASVPCCPEMKSGSCCDQAGKKSEKMNQAKKETKDAAVIYTCPMHPEVTSDKPGKCPKCGMDLRKKKINL